MLVVLAFGQLAAGIGIFFRHAIPRSPRIFHWLTLPPLATMVIIDFLLAWLALTGEDEVVGLDPVLLLLTYFISAAITWWVLVSYAVFHYFRGWRNVQRGVVSIEGKTDEAARQAEDRFSEGELEKKEIRERLTEDAAAVKADLDEASSSLEARIARLEQRIEEVLRLIEKGR